MYDSKVGGAYIGSLVKSLPMLAKEGIAADYFSVSENCHVDDGRNEILRSFMRTNCTDLLFIDSDVGWEPESIVKILRYDRDVVAGVYPKKTPDGVVEEYPVKMEPGKEIWAEADGLVEVVGAPTGFMRIRRGVVEQLINANKHRQFLGQNHKDGDPPYTIVFERTLESGHRFSGDYSFCNKWRSMGGKIYVDPEMNFSHEGNKEWLGCLGDYWRRVHGVSDGQMLDRAKQAVAAIRSGSADFRHVAEIAEWWQNKEWAAGVGMATACMLLSRRVKGQILECGSGLTTLVMAIGGAEVHSLEHDPIWADRTKNALKALGLSANVHYVPIRDHGKYRWYESWPKLDKIDLLVCDGPPRLIGREGLALIEDQLSQAVMVFDDAASVGVSTIIEGLEKKTGRRFVVMNGDRPYAVSKPVEERMSAA
jgi:hypothetical protein